LEADGPLKIGETCKIQDPNIVESFMNRLALTLTKEQIFAKIENIIRG